MSDSLPTRTSGTTMWTDVPVTPSKTREPFFIYRMAHRALRGRYPLVVLFAIAGAVGGVLLAQKLTPVYRSEGLVRIPFRRAALSDESEKIRQMTVFQEFLRSQVQVMTSDHVVQRAITKWNAPRADGDTPEKRAEGFARSLTVQHPLESEHLLISFTAKDPRLAASGVRAAIDAYIECDEEAARAAVSPIAGDREDGRGDFQKQMEELQNLEHDIGQQFNPNEPGDGRDGTFHRTGPNAQSTFNPEVVVPDKNAEAPLTVNQIAILDPLMRTYLEQQAMMRADLQRLEAAGGMDKNPYTILLKERLAALTKIMDKYAEEFRKFQTSRRNPLSPVSAGAVDARHRLAELRLVEVDRQMTELKTGGTFAGKPTIINGGSVPLIPVQDRRFVGMVGSGALGAAIPVALLVLLGLGNRRVRSADDIVVTTGAPALLGILPQLPDGKVNNSKRAVWSFCVHQVRAILEARHARQQPSAYLITSASPGEGKTRLTTALGRCFAESGSRTLVIDCDLISQGLTRRLGLQPGRDLIDCLREGSILGAVQATDDMNLGVLPLRRGGSVDGMPKGALRRLLDEARRHFDIILIDSGSVLGSIEASLIAPEVDGVILAVTRGQQQPLIEKSIRHIHGVGGQVLGAVFNRARFSRLKTSTPAPLIAGSASALEASHPHHASAPPAAPNGATLPDAPVANAT